MELSGKYNKARIYADIIEDEAIKQIQTLLDQRFVEGESIAIMPDVHAGKGCTIGYTQTIRNRKVCPNLVGVDISCGMLTVKLGKIDLNLKKLDDIIRSSVPAGKSVHKNIQTAFSLLSELKCYDALKDVGRIERSLGTLGGGNHFIEIDIDDEENKYLVIHTGSRNLGKQVAIFYQGLADKVLNYNFDGYRKHRDTVIEEYKKAGKFAEIQKVLTDLQEEYSKNINYIDKDLAYLEGDNLSSYLFDMNICSEYSDLNRKTIATIILQNYFCKSIDEFEYFTTLHNYIDIENKILRKGAISAKQGELVLIPINMRDGSLLCVGKGNPNYNFSAPHGAGRIISRAKAKEKLSLENFKEAMKGIYTTSIDLATLDEAPDAYKGLNDILPKLSDTCEVLKRLKPIYNFKAAD